MKHALLLGNLFQLAIVTLLVVYATREQGRRVLFMLGLAVVLTAVMSLAGCIHQARPAVDTHVAPGCVVTEPPPLLGDAEEATDEDVRRLVAWTRETWMSCAPMQSQDYPPWDPNEPADDGEDLDP